MESKREIYKKAVETLGDGELTVLALISRPEMTPLKEAERASKELSDIGVNKIPESVRNLLPRLRNTDETEVIIVTLVEATPVYEAMCLEEDSVQAKIATKWWVINS